jgi:hypothetical protein
MKTDPILQLIGLAIFLIVTSQTYYVIVPLNKTSNTSLEAVATKITDTTTDTTNTTTNTTINTTTNAIVDINLIKNNYRIITSIIAGGVIAIVALYFLRSLAK